MLNKPYNLGKQRRIHRIFSKDNKCIVVPVDDSLISGPIDGLFDIQNKIKQIESAKPSALMTFSGSATLFSDYSVPLILNLTASTILGQHTNKVLISSVRNAIYLGADAVAVHINISSQYESSMLKNILSVSEECNRYGIPLMILSYPRGEGYVDGKIKDENYLNLQKENNDAYTEKVAHCVRIAFELGADIIKTKYTGSAGSFERVVKSAPGCPVLIAGGNMIDEDALFEMIEGCMMAGGSGVSIGRNVFNHIHSDSVISTIKKIVFSGFSANEAKTFYLNSIKTQN